MKNLVFTFSLIAISSVVHCQNIFPQPGPGPVGIGVTTGLTNILDIRTGTTDDGISLTQTTFGAASIYMKNATTSGHNWSLHSLGNGNPGGSGNFTIYDNTASKYRFFINGSDGNVGIGTDDVDFPLNKLDVRTHTTDDGISITQTNFGAASFYMKNLTTNAHDWSLHALGDGNPGGSGNFTIYDNTASEYRFLINGSDGNVGIGTITPGARTHAVDYVTSSTNAYKIGGLFEEIITAANCLTPTGLWGKVTATGSGSGAGIGVMGQSLLSSGLFNLGVCAQGHGGAVRSVGVEASAISTYEGSLGFAYGVDTYAEILNGDAVGIWATAILNGTGSAYAGFFNGDVSIIGSCNRTVSDNFSSDRKLKNDIKPLENALDKIIQLKPSSYTFKTDKEFEDMRLPEGTQMGLIAQDLEKVFPELVTEIKSISKRDKDGNITTSIPNYKAVKYVNLIPVLIAGIQEQQTQISNQQQTIDELKALVQSMVGTPNQGKSNPTSLAVTLADKNSIVLNQNVPNPFAENTVITYNISVDFSKAEIIFTTNDGIIIKTVSVLEKGQGSLNVFANDLTHGVYTYALVVDGKTIDSKKMIKE